MEALQETERVHLEGSQPLSAFEYLCSRVQVAAQCRENGAEHVDIITADLAETKNADTVAKT